MFRTRLRPWLLQVQTMTPGPYVVGRTNIGSCPFTKQPCIADPSWSNERGQNILNNTRLGALCIFVGTRQPISLLSGLRPDTVSQYSPHLYLEFQGCQIDTIGTVHMIYRSYRNSRLGARDPDTRVWEKQLVLTADISRANVHAVISTFDTEIRHLVQVYDRAY